MNDVSFISGKEINDKHRAQMAKIFAEGFYVWLKYFSKDIDKLAKAFIPAFTPESFYLAVVGGKVVSMAACTDGKTPCVNVSKCNFIKHFGLVRGIIAKVMLKKEFEKHPYPFEIESGCGSIEFVAADKDFRGRGITQKLIEYIFASADCKSYVLEVADNNLSAIRLYTKLGFSEFVKIECKNKKQAGFDNYLYMKYEK